MNSTEREFLAFAAGVGVGVYVAVKTPLSDVNVDVDYHQVHVLKGDPHGR